MVEIEIGTRFERLQVLEKQMPFYLCLCDCGRTKAIRRTNLLNGSSKSCGCFRKQLATKRNNERKLKTSSEDRQLNYIYSQYKSHAKYNKRDFTLSREEFKNIAFSNCHYCGTPPSNLVKQKRYDGPFYYNGIDRKNTKGHYTYDNSLSCCITCNRAKNNMSYEEFKSWIERIKNY